MSSYVLHMSDHWCLQCCCDAKSTWRLGYHTAEVLLETTSRHQ